MSSHVDGFTIENGLSRQMLRPTSNISSKFQLVFDIILVELALLLCIYIKGLEELSVYYYPAVITPVLMWVIYSNSGIYRRHNGRLSKLMSISFAWTKVVTFLIVFAFLLKVSEDYSRVVISSWFVISLPVQVLAHVVVNSRIIKKYKKRESIPSLLVGSGQLGGYLSEKINANPWTAHHIVGLVCDDGDGETTGLSRLGGMDELREVVERYSIRRVYFVLSMEMSYQIRELQMELLDLNVDIVWAPDIFGLHMISPSVKEVAGVPLYYLSESPMVEGALVSKLVLDKTVAVIALVLFSPIMLLAAVAVRLSSSGPILYRQVRHGLDGRVFYMLKFRSMKLHEEEEGKVSQAIKGDCRVTKTGLFLRKTSIDELPQIFNVLKGDMSLVGPRPHAKSHNHFYADKINAYMSRHRILPGMTGLAQVNGCRGETGTLEKMEKRVEYDMAYINNWSIWLDIRIIIKTAYTLFSKNAY